MNRIDEMLISIMRATGCDSIIVATGSEITWINDVVGVPARMLVMTTIRNSVVNPNNGIMMFSFLKIVWGRTLSCSSQICLHPRTAGEMQQCETLSLLVGLCFLWSEKSQGFTAGIVLFGTLSRLGSHIFQKKRIHPKSDL